MALPYINGLDNKPQETAIAEAVVARLTTLSREKGLFLEYVGETPAVPSRLDAESFQVMMGKMVGRAPAAFVVIDATRPIAGGMTNRRDRWEREFDVTVAVFSKHRRDTVDGRMNPDAVSQADDKADPGIRAICELIDTLLLGWPLGEEGIYELEPGRMETTFAGIAGTLREMRYRVTAERRRKADSVAEYLETIKTTYQVAGADDAMAAETELSP